MIENLIKVIRRIEEKTCIKDFDAIVFNSNNKYKNQEVIKIKLKNSGITARIGKNIEQNIKKDIIKLIMPKFPNKYILAVLNCSFTSVYYISKIGSNSVKGVNSIPFIEMKKEHEDIIIKLYEYVEHLEAHTEKFTEPADHIMESYFRQIIKCLIYEYYFEKELKKGGYDIWKFFDNVPTLTPDNIMLQIRIYFSFLYDVENPVRQRTYYFPSLKEIEKMIE